MIASSVLNPITFKNVPTSNTYPNMWNTLHADRKQGTAKVIPYNQKFQKEHVVYLQFESTSAVSIVLKSYFGMAEIETFAGSYHSPARGTAPDIRYYTNFIVTLDADYYDKKIYFKATQGSDVLTSEPIYTADYTAKLANGSLKYIKYTNLDRIDSDLDDRFIDWEILDSAGSYMDFFVEGIDIDANDTDESEILEGSQSMVILSASYYSGREFKSDPIPDYMASRLGLASSLDVFMVNGIQYIKKGGIDQNRYGSSTLYQIGMKLTQKLAIGINVDNIGLAVGETTPPISGTPMYIGSVVNSAPSESEVKSMTELPASKVNQTKVYTITSARFCFAYPTTFGALSSILDNAGDEIISGFRVFYEDYTIGANTINFTVVTLKPLVTVISHTVQYKF